MKGQNLKVNIPSKNKFLPENNLPSVAEKQSPFRKIYTPTPTKKLINMNLSEGAQDPLLWWNQLSNKGTSGIPKMSMESPHMFLQESRCYPMYIDQKFGTPNKFMSPTSQYANPDFLRYHQAQLSNGYFMPDNREMGYLNASPYLLRNIVPKNFNYNNINITNHYGKDSDAKEEPKKDREGSNQSSQGHK